MNRVHQLKKLKKQEQWDIAIIGGGACGLGIAVDAATRGYKTVLFEAYDFAKGTSSRSTKLVHGGVRYLAQGDVAMVYEALKERGLLAKNATHLVSSQPFVIPSYNTVDSYYYGTGLKVYNWMARSLSLGKTKFLNEEETLENLPTLKPNGLKSGIVYYDGQFDDARLAINLAQTAIENGAVLLNYSKVIDLLKNKKNKIKGLVVQDMISGDTKNINAKVVINATGVFLDDILKMDGEQESKKIVPSQGVHLVFDKSFLPSSYALMVPKTDDGRVLFAVPWYDKLIVGTTDTLIEKPSFEPQALEEEIAFILKTLNDYLVHTVTRDDVLSVFAGLRPLAAPKEGKKKTKEISRSHKILVSESGLVTITGGKWTTYRKVAEDTIDKVIRAHKLKDSDCQTENLSIHGNIEKNLIDKNNPLYRYGSDIYKIERIQEENEQLKTLIHPSYKYTFSEVVWAARNEMAMTVEDVLARRIRLLFLDAKAAIEAAPLVADILASELNKDDNWKSHQVESFTTLANNYLLK